MSTHGSVLVPESLSARLIYGSGVLKINMPRYYWVIKFVRRQLSKLNRGIITDVENVHIPLSVYNDLQLWVNEVRANRWYNYDTRTVLKTAVLYTDASEAGWGAVLFTPKGEVLGTGAAWTNHIEINRAEAIAVHHAFQAFIKQWEGIDKI